VADEDDKPPEFDFEGLDFSKILHELRNAAWLRAGATYLGGAVADYQKTLIENGMDQAEAREMTVETIRAIFTGFSSAIPGTIQVCVQAAEMWESRKSSQKEHKGKVDRS
jgi:hypothetical protein